MNFSEFLENAIQFTSFSRNGEIKVLVDDKKQIFIVDGIYIDRFKQSSIKDPIGTYEKLKDWVTRGMAEQI